MSQSEELIGVGEEWSVQDTLEELRHRVLAAALSVLAVAMPIISVLVALQAWRLDSFDRLTALLCIWVLIFPLLRLLRAPLGFRSTALALLGVLLMTVGFITWRGGLTGGSFAVSALILLLAALFFGRRGAMIAMVAVLSVFAVAGTISVFSDRSISVEMWDPRSGIVWVRQTLIFALLGIAIAVTELYVVEQLAREVERHRGLAAREREQRLALEHSERERAHDRVQREQAQRALEQSRRIEALARMSGGVAHDFNNALTVIIGGAEMAKESLSPSSEAVQLLDEVIEAANGAASLAHRLLTIGRQQVARPQPTQISDVLKRLQGATRRVLPADVRLVMSVPSGDAAVWVDPLELERALLNLVLNARDAMTSGGMVTIGWNREVANDHATGLSDGQRIALFVADDGNGMDPETLERIFDPFFTTKADKGGTGLGLATVYAFAHEAGGDAVATSAPGLGTTVTIRLPEYTGPPGAGPATAADASSATPVAPGGRILVVDDRADVRASMVRILSHDGFHVSESEDGAGALRLLAGGMPFRLMCIDGVLPGLGTADVIERARELVPAMPVLVCSGYVQEELLRRGIATGRYNFLPKPFSAQQLLTIVHQTIASKPSDPA